MKTIRATLIDVDYITKDEKPIIRLILKKKRFFRLYDSEFEPYFYVGCEAAGMKAVEKALMEISVAQVGRSNAKFVRVEEEELEAFGKPQKLLKVFCKHPGQIPLLRDKAAKIGKVYEADIPFARRYMMDRRLAPFDEVELKYEGKIVKKVERVGEGSTVLRMLAFDIETYNPRGEPDSSRDPAVMISYAGNGEEGKKEVESGVLSYKDIKGAAFVKKAASEKQMIDDFCAHVKKTDAELLLGYNSAQFDLPYLKERAARTGTKLVLGRDGSDYKARKRGMNEVARVVGRIHIDLYLVTRFLGIIGAIKATQYTLKETYAEIVGRKKEKAINKLDVWRLWDDEQGRKELAEYSLDDAVSTLEIGEKVLPMEFELSRLCGASLFDVCGASASQLVEMLLMRRSGERNMLIPNRPGDDEAGTRMAPVQGAYVKMPQAGIYDNLAVLDFRGLYPSIICSYNIDPFTLVKKEEGGANEKGGAGTESSGKDVYVSPMGHAFSKHKLGIVPTVLAEIMDKRAQVKQELKKWSTKPESEEYRQFYARSQALKVLANSYYGYLLYSRSRWYSREAGESTTAWGRQYVQDMEQRAEKAGFHVLYMDTDSLFLELGAKGKEDVKKFLKEVNDSLPGRMELELEGFYPRGVFVMKKGTSKAATEATGAKKKYALLREDGRIKIRGFELVRRDWSKVAKDTQMAVLEAILKDGSKEKAVAVVKEKISELKEGRTKMEDVVIYTRLRKGAGKYAIISPEVSAVRKAQAKGVKVEERGLVGYIITKTGKSISDKAELVELAKDYDPDYYVERQILPSVMKILGELGCDEEELKSMGKQSKLGAW